MHNHKRPYKYMYLDIFYMPKINYIGPCKCMLKLFIKKQGKCNVKKMDMSFTC